MIQKPRFFHPALSRKALLIAARLDPERFASAVNMARASGLSVYALPEEKRNSLNAGYRDLILFDN